MDWPQISKVPGDARKLSDKINCDEKNAKNNRETSGTKKKSSQMQFSNSSENSTVSSLLTVKTQ